MFKFREKNNIEPMSLVQREKVSTSEAKQPEKHDVKIGEKYDFKTTIEVCLVDAVVVFENLVVTLEHNPVCPQTNYEPLEIKFAIRYAFQDVAAAFTFDDLKANTQKFVELAMYAIRSDEFLDLNCVAIQIPNIRRK